MSWGRESRAALDDGPGLMGDILFLAHRVPYPPDRGDKMRSFHMLRHLAGRGRVHLGAFADHADDQTHVHALRETVSSVHVERRPARAPAMARGLLTGQPLSVAAFASPGMRRFVERTLATAAIDTIVAFSGQMARFVPEALDGRRFLMDFVDMDSAKFAAYAAQRRGPAAWLDAREARRLAAFERDVAARADASIFVSAAEATLFARAAPCARVAVVENGIDLARYDPAFPPAPDAGPGPLIVFTGQMDYRPNIEAVTIFAEQAMPLIRAARPEARFAIVGRDPAPAVRRLAGTGADGGANGGVTVTGTVPDVRGWLAAADVVVAPLRLARGIQNKLLEAMAMARAIVASPAAFEGIDAVPGRDLLVADGARAEADAVLALLADPPRAAALGAAARARVEARYGWAARLAALDALLAA